MRSGIHVFTLYLALSLTACSKGFESAKLSSNIMDPRQSSPIITCTPESEQSCPLGNGTGTQTCTSSGTWGTCGNLISCNSGYTLKDGTCVANACTPNTTQSCPINNGTGTQTCSSSGTWGACGNLASCNSGYTLKDGTCVANACTPNTTQSCPINNGTGTQTCSSSGTWGTCGNLTSCNSGYNLQNGTCVANTCTPNTTQSCPINNGTGTQTCNSAGSTWGTCGNLTSCNSGYNLQNGTCVANTCTPNTTQSCPINNGTGTQTCNSAGSAWGACGNLTSCNSGYTLKDGACVADRCTPTLTKTCSDSIQPLAMFPGGESLLPKVTGTYSDTVPDTLDLAERARLYLQGATTSLLPDYDYIPGGPTIFLTHVEGEFVNYVVKENGVYVAKKRTICWGVFPCIENDQAQNWGKVALGMYLARRMSNYDADNKDGTLMAQLISTRNMVDTDVSFRILERGGLPALQFLETGKEQAITPTTVVLEALSEMYQLGHNNSAMKSAIDELVLRHHRHIQSTVSGGKVYYYYWNQIDQVLLGEQGTIRYLQPFIQGRALYALSRWRNATNDATANLLSNILREYLFEYNSAELWQSPNTTLYPVEAGQFVGQMHSYLGAVNGLLESAKLLKDTNPASFNVYGAFAKNVYDFVKRQNRTGQVGHFGEIGTTGDMIRLGILLSELGISDEWEDVDAWTRNTLAEGQIDDTIAGYIPNTNTNALSGWNMVGAKSKGLFLSDATHAFEIPLNKNFRYNVDGPSNAIRAMHEVWKHIIVVKDGFARINLLLNRAHRYMDIKSHVPYRGQVDIHTKSSIGPVTQIGVRIPSWGQTEGKVSVRKNGALLAQGTASSGDWYWYSGGYIIIRAASPSSNYEITFDLPVFTQPVYTLRDSTQFWYEGVYPNAVGTSGEERVQTFTGTFRGNTLVDVSGRSGSGIPRYQRYKYRDFISSSATPTIAVVRAPLESE
ncbi:MAG: hypothetical protein AB7G93_19325 [Bdellovibrionales bacterium]